MDRKHEHETVIHIDGQPFKVSGSILTVRDLLVLRFGDSADLSRKLLTLKKGNDFAEHPDPSEVLQITPGLHFVILDTTPTTVS
ncbi:hypothetical protein [Deinococcus sp.]|uniref:hypothetical protein n=1 Tax=Deinococcus sp. TaxID=47478 RepID=UPI003919D128